MDMCRYARGSQLKRPRGKETRLKAAALNGGELSKAEGEWAKVAVRPWKVTESLGASARRALRDS